MLCINFPPKAAAVLAKLCGSKDFNFIEGIKLQTESRQNGRGKRYARPFRKYLSDGYKKERGHKMYCVRFACER